MLPTIMKREILEYLKSSKFLIGLVLTVILITISTIINIGDYEQRRQDYLDAKENAERAFRYEVFRKPEVLSTLVQGKDRKLGNRLQFSYMDLPIRTSGYMGFSSYHDRFFSSFDAVDYAFVVRVVLSLLVIFLAYNSISEEKTNGTLKLTVSNQIPRDQLLLGKLLGGLFVILSSLIIATLLALIIMLVNPLITVTGAILLRIGLMFVVSALYLLCFYMITLFVSVVVNKPALSLMILLQVWVFLIVIYPNLSVILSKQIVKLPSPERLVESKRSVFQEYEAEYNKTRDDFREMVVSGKHDDAITLKNVEMNAIRTERWHQVDVDFSNQLTRQARVARQISTLSPAVLYDRIMTKLAGTDIDAFERFIRGIEVEWREYIELFKLRYTDIKAYRQKSADKQEFTISSEPIVQSFVTTLPNWILMFMISVVFLLLSYVSFLRKDVR